MTGPLAVARNRSAGGAGLAPPASGLHAGWLVSVGVYSLFAAAVFLAHGAEPPLNIDHLAYFRLADDILAKHPDGAYWRSITQIQSYSVLLAYLHALTGSHVLSLKIVLGAVTVVAMLAFELLIGVVSDAKWKSIVFTVVSGAFVTFGASFWGYTDFSASLNRTLLIPFALAGVWIFIAADNRPIRFIVFPLLTAASLGHLSAYYVIGVLGLVELWDWGVRRGFARDRGLAWFAASLVAAALVREALKWVGADNTVDLSGLVIPLDRSNMLPPAEAWRLELYAYPWRNMPLPLTTVATIAASFGVIFLVAVASALRLWRRGELTRIDREMLVLAAAIVVFAYGLQTMLWLARQLLPVYPFSLEEVRAVNLLMIPALYFAFRLFEYLWSGGRGSAAIAVVVALLLQPVLVVRLAPEAARSALLESVIGAGLLRRDDTLRLLYARQLLGLEAAHTRFYYSALGVVGWLQENADRETRVVSTLNELLLADVTAIGPFNGNLSKAIADPSRAAWARMVADVDRSIGSGSLSAVELVARKYRADYAVVPWPVPGAAYSDRYYSIVRMGG